MTELDAYRGRGALVFGATGFIGRWVVNVLATQGARVHRAARDAATLATFAHEAELPGDAVACDIRDERAVADAIRTLRPAIVFNLAGYGVDPTERDETEYFRLNGGFVTTLCAALCAARLDEMDASWNGQRLVHVGSQLEYGPVGGDLREDSTPAPTTVYGRSKLAGTRAVEEAGRSRGLRGVTARLFNVYGPGEHGGRLLPALLATAATRAPLALTAGSQRLDFTYVEDVAEGLLRLGLAPVTPGEAVNLATGRLTSVREFAKAAARVLDLDEALLEFGRLPDRADEMQYRPVSTARLRAVTRWTPETTVETGVRRTLQWLSYASR